MISVSDMGNVDVQNKLRIEVEFFPSKERRRVELDGNATGRLRDKDEIRIISVASGG
jgi:hypothetical protein